MPLLNSRCRLHDTKPPVKCDTEDKLVRSDWGKVLSEGVIELTTCVSTLKS